MAVLTEGKHAGEFIGERALGDSFHNEAGTLIMGQDLSDGTVVGKITASSKYTQLAPAAADGSQTVSGILFGNVDATDADTDCVVNKRGPETVNGNDLTWPVGITAPQKAAAITALAAMGIVVL